MKSAIRMMKAGASLVAIITMVAGVLILFKTVYDLSGLVRSFPPLGRVLLEKKGTFLAIVILIALGLILALLTYGSALMLEVADSVREKTRNSTKLLHEMYHPLSPDQEKP